MKKVFFIVLALFMGLSVLTACAAQESSSQNGSATEEISTDLPDLNGDYAYLRVEVISRDQEAKTMQVKVVDFGESSGVNVGVIPVGTEGEIDCSDLLMMGGIKEGAEWVIAYQDAKQSSLPVRIYSIESIDSFSERLETYGQRVSID